MKATTWIIAGAALLLLPASCGMFYGDRHDRDHEYGHGSGHGWRGHGPGMLARFSEIDANDDGKISAAEIERHHEAEFAGADRNGDGGIDPSEAEAHMLVVMRARMPEMIAWHFERFDDDENGRIEPSEWPGNAERLVNRLDKDNDGAISRKEAERFRKRWRDMDDE